MKSKPTVMEHFSTIHTSFVVDFHFKNNITILMGNSGTGKTAAFSFMKECMAVNPNIVCLNYLDYQKDILEIIKKAKEGGVKLDPLSRYYVVEGGKEPLRTGECGSLELLALSLAAQNTYVMNYSSVSTSNIKKAVQVLERVRREPR